MDYLSHLQSLLQIEKEEDKRAFKQLTENMPVAERRSAGMTWYPIAIRDTEMGYGDFLTVEVERTTHHEIIHNLRTGMSAALFSNYDHLNNPVEGTITYINSNKLKISLRTDELPEWSRNGKLGIDAIFDKNSYDEMESALKQASARQEKKEEGHLIKILTGERNPTFNAQASNIHISGLNSSQLAAVNKVIAANELAIVHGPPGTGKTTTLVQSIKMIVHQLHQKVLVVAPSNAAVDLLTEKLADENLQVLRVGNPAKVNERQLALTLDNKMAEHSSMKEIKRLKKQASEYKNMAHKYKRNFGFAEREQRKALFNEARKIGKEVEQTEQYIIDDLVSKANVITATLVGANHYSIRSLKFETVVIDEAAQAIEPACWIAILKAKKVVMAGDYNQLPPTIKSVEAAKKGLNTTLMEKCATLYPQAVMLLEEQYRMHEVIMGFSSNEFYNGQLKANAAVAKRLLFADDVPLLFIDTAGCGFDERTEGTSISNPEEAAFLLKHLSTFVQQLTQFYNAEDVPSIAVISPYKHQVEVLKELIQSYENLQQLQRFISVNTIDSFQGQERDIVYISMTRSNTNNSIGFLTDVRRMNVAMTRARKKLVVTGDSATLSQLPFYADFITYAQQHNGYCSAWEFMD